MALLLRSADCSSADDAAGAGGAVDQVMGAGLAAATLAVAPAGRIGR